MSETRTYIVPEQPQQNPNDNLAMMAMLNGNGGFGGNGMWNNPFMYLVWMWMMRWMNNGWGENGDCQNAGTIDDEDAGDGTTMRRWYATMVANGTMVDWEDVI